MRGFSAGNKSTWTFRSPNQLTQKWELQVSLSDHPKLDDWVLFSSGAQSRITENAKQRLVESGCDGNGLDFTKMGRTVRLVAIAVCVVCVAASLDAQVNATG